jgi:hypothetical protein
LRGSVRGMPSEVAGHASSAARAELGVPRLAIAEPDEAPRSQSEDAYVRIRDKIVSLDMPPGSVVEEARLREELAIGRTPIREALQRLAQEKIGRAHV